MAGSDICCVPLKPDAQSVPIGNILVEVAVERFGEVADHTVGARDNVLEGQHLDARKMSVETPQRPPFRVAP